MPILAVISNFLVKHFAKPYYLTAIFIPADVAKDDVMQFIGKKMPTKDFLVKSRELSDASK